MGNSEEYLQLAINMNQFGANTTYSGIMERLITEGSASGGKSYFQWLFANKGSITQYQAATFNPDYFWLRSTAGTTGNFKADGNASIGTNLKVGTDLNVNGAVNATTGFKINGTSAIADGNRWAISSVNLIALTSTSCYTTYKGGIVTDSNCPTS